MSSEASASYLIPTWRVSMGLPQGLSFDGEKTRAFRAGMNRRKKKFTNMRRHGNQSPISATIIKLLDIVLSAAGLAVTARGGRERPVNREPTCSEAGIPVIHGREEVNCQIWRRNLEGGFEFSFDLTRAPF